MFTLIQLAESCWMCGPYCFESLNSFTVDVVAVCIAYKSRLKILFTCERISAQSKMSAEGFYKVIGWYITRIFSLQISTKIWNNELWYSLTIHSTRRSYLKSLIYISALYTLWQNALTSLIVKRGNAWDIYVFNQYRLVYVHVCWQLCQHRHGVWSSLRGHLARCNSSCTDRPIDVERETTI